MIATTTAASAASASARLAAAAAAHGSGLCAAGLILFRPIASSSSSSSSPSPPSEGEQASTRSSPESSSSKPTKTKTKPASVADDLVRYARAEASSSPTSSSSPAQALETLDHGQHLVGASKPRSLVRLALAGAELAHATGRTEASDAYCRRALDLITEHHEEMNLQTQTEASLLARQMLTRSHLQRGEDDLADELTCGYADGSASGYNDLGMPAIAGDRNRNVLTAIIEGLKGFSDHALGARDLAEERWIKVREVAIAPAKPDDTQAPSPTSRWLQDHKLNHTMACHALFLHCAGQSGGGAEDWTAIAARAASSAESLAASKSAALWGSPLLQAEISLGANFSAAQVLAKAGESAEAEKRLEGVLVGISTHFPFSGGEGGGGGGCARTALVLTELAQVYVATHRYTLAEGLFRTAFKSLGPSPEEEEKEGEEGGTLTHTHRPCHPSALALLEHRYSGLLSKIPRREAEAARMAERAEGRWRHESHSRTIEEAAAGGLVDLATRRLFYLE